MSHTEHPHHDGPGTPGVGPGGRDGPGGPLDPREMAALFVAGALTDSELLEFERWLESGDQSLIEALAQVRAASEALVNSIANEAEAPESARRVLQMRLGMWEAAGNVRSAATDTAVQSRLTEHEAPEALHEHAHRVDPLVVVRKNQIKWRPTGLPGVKGCTLYADKKNNRRTVLLNMAPGSYIPDHNHGGIEEVLVLEGDLNVGDVPLKAGDYFRAQPDTRHGTPVSPNGCIALVFSTYSAITTRTKVQFAFQVLKDLLRLGKRSA